MAQGSATVGTAGPPTVPPAVLRRVVRASFLGNFVEWFDYAVYGYLATSITATFFAGDDEAGLLKTFAIFAISFIIRPIGGLIWGNIGDRVGRRNALSWSIIIMTVATTAIALIPGHNTIGIAAPILLLLARMVQGFSASGEYAGAAAFLAEYAPTGRRGLYTSVVPASTAAGLLFGSLISVTLTVVLPEDQMHSWG